MDRRGVVCNFVVVVPDFIIFFKKKTEGAPPPKIFTVLCPLKVVLLLTYVTSNFTC